MGHSAVVTEQGRMYAFGGRGAQGRVLGDLWCLDLHALRWEEVAVSVYGDPPPPRWAHAAVLHGNSMLVFGGKSSREVFNDMWELKLADHRWQRPLAGGAPPPPVYGHAMVMLPDRRHLLVLGGREPGAEHAPDNAPMACYEFDVLLRTWDEPRHGGHPPRARMAHSAVVVAGNVLVFGGVDPSNTAELVPVDDSKLQCLSLFSMSWWTAGVRFIPPAARYGMSAVRDGKWVYCFGGWGPRRASNELVVLDLDKKEDKELRARTAAVAEAEERRRWREERERVLRREIEEEYRRAKSMRAQHEQELRDELKLEEERHANAPPPCEIQPEVKWATATSICLGWPHESGGHFAYVLYMAHPNGRNWVPVYFGRERHYVVQNLVSEYQLRHSRHAVSRKQFALATVNIETNAKSSMGGICIAETNPKKRTHTLPSPYPPTMDVGESLGSRILKRTF